jgi:hypothetical protein
MNNEKCDRPSNHNLDEKGEKCSDCGKTPLQIMDEYAKKNGIRLSKGMLKILLKAANKAK